MFLSKQWAAIAAAVCMVSPAAAQTSYPDHPIKLIVPFTPGGASDITARIMAERLTGAWNQSVVVDNRPGATGIIGTDMVAKAKADGYTLALVPSSQAINAVTRSKLPYDTLKDFTYITITASVPLVLVTSPESQVGSVKDLIALAQREPGKLTYASSGIGGAPHFAAELFKTMAHLDLVHVPYKGSTQAHPDVMTQKVNIMFDTIVAVLPQIQAGKLKALAVTSAARSGLLPNVPTMAEAALPGYEASSWGALIGPAGMPPEVTKKIAHDVSISLASPDVRAKLAQLGADVVANSPEDATRYISSEMDKWSKVAKIANIKED